LSYKKERDVDDFAVLMTNLMFYLDDRCSIETTFPLPSFKVNIVIKVEISGDGAIPYLRSFFVFLNV
jgi:hypothetical protein